MLALQYHLDPHGDFISATPVEARVLQHKVVRKFLSQTMENEHHDVLHKHTLLVD